MKLADPTKSSSLTHYTTLDIAIGTHFERLTLYVVPNLDSHIVLGTPWLKKHHVRPDLNENTVTFPLNHCGPNKCLSYGSDVIVKGACLRRTTQSRERILHSTNVNGVHCETVSIEEFCDTIVDEKTGTAVII